MVVELTMEELLDRLRAQVQQRGSQQAWAAAAGVSPQYVHDVLCRRRGPGASILAALGVQRVVRFVTEARS